MNRLSIIVPIFNSKETLKECLNSICQQVRQNVEIILINDCSTDSSIKICKKYIKKFDFISLVNLKKNRGVAYCRNIGIKKATGEYICFVDSDDKLFRGSINNVLNHIRIFSGKELFVLRYFDSRNKKINKSNTDTNQIYNLKTNKKNKSIINCIQDFDKFKTISWNFIVNKKFLHLNNIYFKSINVSEDFPFVLQILCLTKSFKIIEKPTYISKGYTKYTFRWCRIQNCNLSN